MAKRTQKKKSGQSRQRSASRKSPRGGKRSHLGFPGTGQGTTFLFVPPGTADTATGIFVDEETAATFSAVWAAVRVISDTISTLPAKVYRVVGEDTRERQRNHPVQHIILREPNPDMTPATLFQTMMAHVLLWGNTFSEIERNGAFLPVALHPIHPRRVVVRRSNATGRLVYEITPSFDGAGPHRAGTILTADEVLHIPGLSFNGLVGLSPVRVAAKNPVAIGLAAERFAGRFYQNDATPSGILSTPGRFDDEQAQERLRKSWEDIHQGVNSSHRIAILEDGLKFEAIGIPPEDAEFLATRKFQITDVARIFRVPPHKIGDLEKATFSNIEEQNLDFVQDSIRPWLVKFEQEMNKKLFATHEFFIEFDLRAQLRADSKTRFQTYKDGFGVGAYSVNDILRLENQNPIGPAGDQRFVPANFNPLPEAATGETVDAGDALFGLIADSVAPLVADALGRARVAEGQKVGRLYRGFLQNRDGERLGYELMAQQRDSHERLLRLTMPCIRTIATMMGSAPPVDPPESLHRWAGVVSGSWPSEESDLAEWLRSASWTKGVSPEDLVHIVTMISGVQEELNPAPAPV